MHIEFVRDKSKVMPNIDNPEEVESMRVWHCNYSTFDALQRCVNLKTLLVATLPEKNFKFLTKCKNLRYLDICHLPKVSDLSTLLDFENLETLILQTLPSWDASGKIQEVDSLVPLSNLPSLKHLELFGVRPASKSPSELLQSKSLISVRVSKYSKKELNSFYKQSGINDDYAPEPTIAN